MRERYLSLSGHYGDKFVQVDAGAGVSTISQTLSAIMLKEIELNAKGAGQ